MMKESMERLRKTEHTCVHTSEPASRTPAPKDALSQRGAMALARRLERYWQERGRPTARFWAEPIDERFDKVGTYEIYRVVCNLVNGLPPVYADH